MLSIDKHRLHSEVRYLVSIYVTHQNANLSNFVNYSTLFRGTTGSGRRGVCAQQLHVSNTSTNVYGSLMELSLEMAVSRWLPTAAAQVRARVRSCGICGGQSGTGAGFLRVLWFPLSIFIPPIAPQSPSSITRGWYNRPTSGQRTKWTQSHPTKNNKK
jgi:hypothetical protein